MLVGVPTTPCNGSWPTGKTGGGIFAGNTAGVLVDSRTRFSSISIHTRPLSRANLERPMLFRRMTRFLNNITHLR
jgi:hypothetical protein